MDNSTMITLCEILDFVLAVHPYKDINCMTLKYGKFANKTFWANQVFYCLKIGPILRKMLSDLDSVKGFEKLF